MSDQLGTARSKDTWYVLARLIMVETNSISFDRFTYWLSFHKGDGTGTSEIVNRSACVAVCVVVVRC